MRKLLVISVSSLALSLTACNSSSDSDAGTGVVNSAPVVSAGADQSIQEREQVQLSGSASDADGDALTWGPWKYDVMQTQTATENQSAHWGTCDPTHLAAKH